ncbi:MAG: 50S ribosomal protein L22 [Candidatus Yanofskybacteria bacterium RIFCSPHIGHO2_02_FULL_41_29]|uniref:Large ribosomal subunit protein uL22 n=1 Tax=Candidatus Yanofskybacteria bacterium RIFCSPHIGHO2_01_FULL_41_53 TaxID=1802663 RepID=A0A1F8EJY8_9BACT|nr:MAG: 50S ribosomal protein L22 [Candidatus Yanofskybacteria bacterium RIFCSPHIGHO2_01_FULL_41_53]OGN11596.1 MAG: 50S ribosomal protein L22 [Candidatus Yanofskybacteria bacterium RIFCSPHIGHO2_02_FULL_41_29]OGN18184.1 MAG: 50S ribosomal protein L22 [Candidatus Yanofskybacteria bacterium RIFCSPHIGHO2_12_FULL_41_9]OGN22833.1 MAG: 50S ribosomal protein L22 [Candidatus Yanofskybacteria bacterium RIFCSPLOWO2_01_FULL_41_67]OGN30100.1 MAG: 50S ribosomal protein L22 [Candidatus Yanofskybacteria bacter
MSEVRAQLNNLRIAPRKVRAVVGLIKGKDVLTALAQLDNFVRKSSRPIKKLVDSAIANAENNFNMIKENLYVKEIVVNEGVKLKRFRAKGFGRAALIQKKTSHIVLTLGERKAGLRMERKAKTKKEEVESTTRAIKGNEDKKPEVKREIGMKGNMLGNLGKKIFQRKAI